jgi:hypothetical protein
LLVDRWTSGEYQIVVVSDALDHRIAYRGGFVHKYPQQSLHGRNLYVRHQADPEGKGGGHWESMERRPTRRPDRPDSSAAGPSSSKPGSSKY